MDCILSQLYNYAIVTPVKNYSNIKDKRITMNTFSRDIDEIEHIETAPRLTQSNEIKTKAFFIRFGPLEKKKRRIKYFYDKSQMDENLELFPPNPLKKNFYTTKDRQIKKYFGDPFCRMEINTVGRFIYKDEKKLVIKIFSKTKYRSVNWKFFKENKSSICVSFNLKTGNFIIIEDNGVKKGHRGHGLRFRTNSFEQLKRLLSSKSKFYLDSYFSNIIDKKTKDEFIKMFDDNVFIRKINEELLGSKLPVSFIPAIDYKTDEIFNIIIDDFVKKRGIKVPNNYKMLLFHYYPLQKILKKNDNKLVQSILDMFGVKTKGTVKYLHENPQTNISKFINLCHFFGEDYYHYVLKINPIFFQDLIGIGDKNSVWGLTHEVPRYILSKDEKENLLHVINDYMINRTSSNNFEIIVNDHLGMILRVRQYEPDARFSYRTYTDFNQSHTRLSTILRKIQKGWTIEYQFEEKMLNDVEGEMVALKDEYSQIKFKPFILKTDEDYIEEGSYMHHCVAGYSNKDKSIIVSLRTLDGVERVTSEFDIQSGRCIQSRYFTNKTPPDFFLDGLELLKEKIHKYARWGLLNWKEKKKVPLKINGIEVVIENKEPTRPNGEIINMDFLNHFNVGIDIF